MANDKPKKQHTPQDFQKAIDELSKMMGYKISVYPVWFQQDNGTFSMKIVTDIIPEKENK